MINKLKYWKSKIQFLIDMINKNNELLKELKTCQDFQKERFDLLVREISILKEELTKIKYDISANRGITKEILWGEVFNNKITDSQWLNDKRFSPGRWAVGYPYLYVIYRILDEVKPKTILDLGLGESTKMLSQYALANPTTEHLIVEHDKNWIDFFSNVFKLPKNSYIMQLELENSKFKEDNAVLCYKDFDKELKDKKFDFISIDAPFGGNAKIYARIDVLKILPQCLSDNFIILVDDYNRKGEKNMVSELEKVLIINNISYEKGVYIGEKECILITSKNNKFLTTM